MKKDYTIVIVTHNMQQAARVSDLTGFMYLGELVEYDETTKIFTKPAEKQTSDYTYNETYDKYILTFQS